MAVLSLHDRPGRENKWQKDSTCLSTLIVKFLGICVIPLIDAKQLAS